MTLPVILRWLQESIAENVTVANVTNGTSAILNGTAAMILNNTNATVNDGNTTLPDDPISAPNTTYFDDDDDFTVPPSEEAEPSGDKEDDEGYRFVAFLLWYTFLVLCCVLPTCCAYRRRRLLEARMQEQHANWNRWQASNMLFGAMGLPPGGGVDSNNDAATSEPVQRERAQRLEQELKKTTMVVSEADLQDKQPSGGSPDNCAPVKVWRKGRIVSLHNNSDKRIVGADKPAAESNAEEKEEEEPTIVVPAPNLSSSPMEYDVEEAEYTAVLRLPSGDDSDGEAAEDPFRYVPGVCAICLSPYEVGDHVSWSPNHKECSHAFHKDCIVPWLAKKEDAKCPVCRQDFCHVDLPYIHQLGHHYHGHYPMSSDQHHQRFPSLEVYPEAYPHPMALSSHITFTQALEMSRMELRRAYGASTRTEERNTSSSSPADSENATPSSPSLAPSAPAEEDSPSAPVEEESQDVHSLPVATAPTDEADDATEREA